MERQSVLYISHHGKMALPLIPQWNIVCLACILSTTPTDGDFHWFKKTVYIICVYIPYMCVSVYIQYMCLCICVCMCLCYVQTGGKFNENQCKVTLSGVGPPRPTRTAPMHFGTLESPEFYGRDGTSLSQKIFPQSPHTTHALDHLSRIWRMTHLTISLFSTSVQKPVPMAFAPLNSQMCICLCNQGFMHWNPTIISLFI